MVITDFDRLQRSRSPNDALFAPVGFSLPGDRPSPEFDLPAASLVSAWLEVVAEAPRARIRALSPDGLQVEAEQRSAVFGFVDRVSMRALPLSSGRSSLVAYSRSRTGWWDLGVNRRRLSRWVSALSQRLRHKAELDGPA